MPFHHANHCRLPHHKQSTLDVSRFGVLVALGPDRHAFGRTIVDHGLIVFDHLPSGDVKLPDL
jgi:hypothetical protein